MGNPPRHLTLKVISLFLIFALGTYYRLRLIHEPVRYDEAYSLIHYAIQPLSGIARDYTYPNNHFLHSMAMHWTFQCFGFSDFGLRLPALISGLLSLILMAWVCWKLSHDYRIVILTMIMGSCSYALLYFSINGRGYSMQMMFALGIILALLYAGRWRSPLPSILLISLCLFGLLYTVPSGIVVAVPLFIGGTILSIRDRKRRWLTYTFLSFGICLLALLSAWGTILGIMAAKVPQYQMSPTFVLASAVRMAADGILPLPVTVVIFLMGLWSLRRYHRDAPWFAALLVLGYALLSIALRHWLKIPILFARSYSPLYPFVYIVMASGIGWAWQISARGPRMHRAAAVCLMSLWIIYMGVSAGRILADPSQLYFPERPIMYAGRQLILPLAARLQKGETIAGAGSSCDLAAAYYVTQARGFHGFYSLYEPQKRGLHTVFLVVEDKSQTLSARENLLSSGFWTTPQYVATSGPVSLFRMDRLR